MAVDEQNKAPKGRSEPMLRFKGRQWIVGANVLVMVVLAAAILVFANYLAFNFNKKTDWTFTGVNSLSEQSRKLMAGLDESVTLTSLYRTFQDPAFEAEAKKFRTAVEDILQLYQTESPSKLDIEFINPARDRDKILSLIDSLRKKTAYQGEAKKHRDLIEKFNNELSAAILQLLQTENDRLQGFVDDDNDLRDVREYTIIMRNCQVLSQQVGRVKEDVGALLRDELPKYTTAVNAIKGFYEQVKTSLTEGGKWLAKVDVWTKRNKVKPPKDRAFFTTAPERYKKTLDAIEAQLEKAKDLPTLKLEDLDRQVRPDTIIIETEDEARVLSFDDVWPPKQRGQYGQALGSAFKDRRFAAEVEISSAILQLTQKKRTAVVFVRHGGQPLFFGGFMGGGQALYAGAKERLEKANFIVKEWDVGAKKEPPDFEDETKPDRIIWILLKPEAVQPPRGMPPQMMRQRTKQFGPAERQAVEAALGDEPRALLIAGWVPPPRNPMMMRGGPPTYEYNEWLKDQWGLEVQYSYPVLEAHSQEPGKMIFHRNPFSITRYELSDQPIVAPLKALKGTFPEAAPIKKSAKLPDGVTLTDLAIIPDRDDTWAESDLTGLSQEYQRKHYTAKGKMDISGPFPIAVAATKTRDDKTAGKVVLVASRTFAVDSVALRRVFLQAPEGYMLALGNPANLSLLVNAVHWLNDNEGLIGKGIESRDIPRLDKLEPGVGHTVARALAVAVWPCLALLAGLAVWFVRRR